METKQLSPGAQAVLDALDSEFYELNSQHMAAAIAALRAVAAIPSASAPVPFTYKLLDIAEELEGAK
jgi:hypothetical protein